jgi:hypothetical protein
MEEFEAWRTQEGREVDYAYTTSVNRPNGEKSIDIVMNQVGNSKFPPIGHLIFFLPTYTMKNKTREIQKNWPRARDRT